MHHLHTVFIVGSSPTVTTIWVFGEMDIISVFETEGKGSIPLGPAKIRKRGRARFIATVLKTVD